MQIAHRDLVGRIFWCSDRGLLLGQFGIGAQLWIGERGIYYCIVVHTAILNSVRVITVCSGIRVWLNLGSSAIFGQSGFCALALLTGVT